jgi:hypothetical protein
VTAAAAAFEPAGVFVNVVGVACPNMPVLEELGRLLWSELVGVADETEFMTVPEDEHIEVVD